MGIPTLSQIKGWDVEHLTNAADHWSGTADKWESTFAEMHQQAHTVSWEGAGASAMRERVTTDKTHVMTKADQLREAATVARRGASDISATQRRVLYAVEDAHNAGFQVGEDLSVTDTRRSRSAAEQAARQSQAQTFAADIRSRATELTALDVETATNITTAGSDIGTPTFPGQASGNMTNGMGKIQLAGHGFKEDSGGKPPTTPQPSNSGIPKPLQDFENQVQGLPPTSTYHAPVTVDDIRRHLQEQNDSRLEDLIRESQEHKCTTHDVVKGLGELAVAGTGAVGAGVTAPSGVGFYLGIATALGSGALAVDDLAQCLP
jgi:hypothetical protein